MAHLEWQESYLSHIDTIDEQHHAIFDLINHLDDAVADRNRELVGHVLNELVAAIINHFEFEEELMASSGYGHLKAHKRLHDRFVEKLVNYSQRFDSGECIIAEFHPFLQQWFGHHIDEDRDYCETAAAELHRKEEKAQGWFARTFGRKE